MRDHSRAYQRQRLAILSAEPLCRHCFNSTPQRIAPAILVDHIVALSIGGTNDRSNLAPACKRCNDDKATAERRFISRGLGLDDVMRDAGLALWIRLARRRP